MRKEDDPVPPLLEQISFLLKFVQNSAKKSLDSPLDPRIKERLEYVEDLVNQLNEVTLETLEREGINLKDAVARLTDRPEQLKLEDKNLLRRSTQLGLDALLLRKALLSAKTIGIRSQDFSKELSEKKVSKKTVKERQKKFKKMGGDSTWMKL